ncbi:hypothetical protein [Halodesulfovibrio aestuarii]|uniref:hypothetical protein n=1 Tax=Halodesulfovibrio aestuarii TaxID=126333 RepID=UPI000486221E
MKNSMAFEKKFVEVVCEKIEELGISHNEFGRRAFGPPDGGRLWRSIRGVEGKKKPRKIAIHEAYDIAEVLGTDLPTLLWHVEKQFNS